MKTYYAEREDGTGAFFTSRATTSEGVQRRARNVAGSDAVAYVCDWIASAGAWKRTWIEA